MSFLIERLLLWIIRNFRQNQRHLQQNKGLLCSYLKWNTVSLFLSKVKLDAYDFSCLDKFPNHLIDAEDFTVIVAQF